MVNEALQFYVDTLVIEAILSNPRLSKQAQSGMVTSLLQKVYGYFKEKLQSFKDSDHKVEMIVNFITPGLLTAFGFPFLGFLSMVASRVFNVNFASMFEEIGSAIKGLISGGKQTSSGEIDSIVERAVSANVPETQTPDEINKFLPEAERVVSSKLTLREAHLIKIAFADYADKNPDVDLMNPEINVKFAAGLFNSALATFISSRHKTTKILIAVIGWILKTMLFAGGFMVMGDIIERVLGGGESTSATPAATSQEPSTFITSGPTQTEFKVNPSYEPENYNGPYARWQIQMNPGAIGSALISWATEIYPDLKGHETAISGTNTFQKVVQVIEAYNAGGPPDVTFIPRNWHSRKQIVDAFINEVANNVHITPSPSGPAGGVKPIPNWHPSKNLGPGTSV